MKVLELKGLKSLRALNAFHTLMLGMKMLPLHFTKSYEEFYEEFSEREPSEQEKLIREAALFVPLDQAEVEALVCFCSDQNGIPFTSVNIKNLGPDELVNAIVSVCMEIGKIQIYMVGEAEKKN